MPPLDTNNCGSLYMQQQVEGRISSCDQIVGDQVGSAYVHGYLLLSESASLGRASGRQQVKGLATGQWPDCSYDNSLAITKI